MDVLKDSWDQSLEHSLKQIKSISTNIDPIIVVEL